MKIVMLGLLFSIFFTLLVPWFYVRPSVWNKELHEGILAYASEVEGRKDIPSEDQEKVVVIVRDVLGGYMEIAYLAIWGTFIILNLFIFAVVRFTVIKKYPPKKRFVRFWVWACFSVTTAIQYYITFYTTPF